MNTKTDFKIQVSQEYEVIGHGPMIDKPRQIGEWWVTPAQDYKGQIPPEIQAKWQTFRSQGVKVKGYLIAEDMRDVGERLEAEKKQREEESKKRQERAKEVALGVLGVMGAVLLGIGTVMLAICRAALSWDPMLIAVLEDGRWICLGTWYD